MFRVFRGFHSFRSEATTKHTEDGAEVDVVFGLQLGKFLGEVGVGGEEGAKLDEGADDAGDDELEILQISYPETD